MKVVIITQNDPFYLAENFQYLLENMPDHSQVVACVLFNVSAFGKEKPLFQQASDTYKTFGLRFFIHYTFKFLINKLFKLNNVRHTLNKFNVPIISLTKGINHKESIQQIKAFNPDLLVSIAGNQIFKKPIIELAPKGCLNLHTALLPKYRGLMPTFWVLKNNEKETGVSVFFVDTGIDSGPIIVQKRVEIKNMTQEQLIRCTKNIGMNAIIEAIEKIYHNNYELIENSESEMTYYSRPQKQDVEEFLKKGKKFY